MNLSGLLNLKLLRIAMNWYPASARRAVSSAASAKRLDVYLCVQLSVHVSGSVHNSDLQYLRQYLQPSNL